MLEQNFASVTNSEVVLSVWRHAGTSACRELVVPDGCQDLILRVRPHPDGSFEFFVSALSETAYVVDIDEGASMIGFRFLPGTRIDHMGLSTGVRREGVRGLLDGSLLVEHLSLSPMIAESLDCLGSGVVSVSAAASNLGVSVRTLQRTIKNGTGFTPHYWHALSRVRRTCRSLHKFDRLVDAADAFGFSDQAHMTREVKRWLGVTPTQVTPGSVIHSRLCDSGYY